MSFHRHLGYIEKIPFHPSASSRNLARLLVQISLLSKSLYKMSIWSRLFIGGALRPFMKPIPGDVAHRKLKPLVYAYVGLAFVLFNISMYISGEAKNGTDAKVETSGMLTQPGTKNTIINSLIFSNSRIRPSCFQSPKPDSLQNIVGKRNRKRRIKYHQAVHCP